MAHQHYKGTGQMHGFRGLLAHGEQVKIRIQGPVGDRAWRIVKFSGIPKSPMTLDQEPVCKVYREEQSSVDGTVNLSDNELLAVVAQKWQADVAVSSTDGAVVIIDNALFSRDIWVSHQDMAGGDRDFNYYIELEEVKVNAAGMAQLAVAAARRT